MVRLAVSVGTVCNHWILTGISQKDPELLAPFGSFEVTMDQSDNP